MQNEIANISTQAEELAFVKKLKSALENGQITPQQAEDLFANVQTHVKALDNVSQGLDEQNHTPEPEFGLGGVATPQEPQPKEKQDINPAERMELTKMINDAKSENDIAEIQQEMRKYKVFPGRKNLRRAYKAKLRAIKHQGESNAKKYDEKFDKRMDKIKNSKVYKNDNDQIIREIFPEKKYIDDTIKRPNIFEDGTFNA